MAKKKLPAIDFKQILLDKGERIVLILAAVFMALLVTFGFIVKGLSAGSASANAEDLARLRKQDQDAFARSTPPPDLAKVSEELLQAGVLSPLEADAYALKRPYFTPLLADDNKWRKPDVLAPDEFQVDLLRGLVKSYIFNRDGTMIKFLVPRDKNKVGALGAAGPAGRGNMAAMMRGMQGRLGGGMGSMGGRGMGAMGGRGMGDMAGGGMGDEAGGAGMMDAGGPQDLVFQDVPVARLEKGDWAGIAVAKPAETTIPIRMAVIQGAFPLKNQMEEFRRTLRFPTIGQMEAEITPEFAGLKIERKKYTLKGKPLSKDWETLDLLKELVPYLMFDPAEPEDQRLMGYGLVWPRDRLVVPRPQLARDQDYPQTKLKNIQSAIEEINKITAGVPLPPEKLKNRFSKGLTDFDPFESTGMGYAAGPGADMEPGMGGMGGKGGLPRGSGRGMGDFEGAGGARGAMRPGMAPGGASGMAPGAGPGMRSGMAPGMGAGMRSGMPGGESPMMPGGGAMGMLDQQQLYPDHVLVRFTDPSVEPGFMYEYQITIRMKNPLYNKEDKAMIKTHTYAEEITSQPVVVPQKLVVPHEFDFYLVTEANHRNRIPNGATPVQIHRWLGRTPNDLQNGVNIPVGDWSIVEQAPASRGEYIGRIENQEVPTWFPLQETFQFASRPDSRNRRRASRGIPVTFNTDHILVDFQGGAQKYTRKDNSVVDDSSEVDALVLTRDGRLVVRNSRDDTDNADRKERLEAWRQWIKEVRDSKDGYHPRQMQQMQQQMGGGGGRNG